MVEHILTYLVILTAIIAAYVAFTISPLDDGGMFPPDEEERK